jgi:hypothetical protein
MQLSIISFASLITEETCLPNPWKFPTEPQVSTEHILKTTALDLKNHNSVSIFRNFCFKNGIAK